MSSLSVKGNWKKSIRFLNTCVNISELESDVCHKYGDEGVKILKEHTPVDTGLTASMWDYEIIKTSDSLRIEWFNRNEKDGYNIAVILLHGHAARDGSWVEGVNYLSPELNDVFDKIAKEMWKELTHK